jgi:carbon-monoxide dehydrogenase large subunit
MGKFALGQSVARTEDPKLLTGRGLYIDDERLADMSYGYVLRSPHAHADIVSIDTMAAKSAPGVLVVLTGQDWAADGLGAQNPILTHFTRPDGSPMRLTPRPALVSDRVRMVGDCVAFVVAETLDHAKDAAELIEVVYQELPSVTDVTKAMDPASVKIWEGCDDNVCFAHEIGDKEKVDAAFDQADHVVNLQLRINRVSPNTMETKGCIGTYDYREERYTIYAGVQQPHTLRHALATDVFRISETQMRVTSGNVGGSFGLKGGFSPEFHLSLWAAKKVGRPVKWISDRSEGLANDEHDRDHVSNAKLALDKDGKFLALDVKNISAIGAYLGKTGLVTPTFHHGGLAGTYLTPAIHVGVSVVFTNTASTGPYRGSGRPESSYIIERLIDKAALELGLDKAEIRRRNTVPSEAMPFKTGLTYTLDCGDFPRNLEDALTHADYVSFEDRRAQSKAEGKLRGIGISNIIEQTAQMFGETVIVRFDPAGTLTVIAGSLSHGQGHDTMYKILISDRLGIDADNIRVVDGDTDLIPFGGGTYASRTAALGGTAATMAADKVIEKAQILAAHILESAEADIEFSDGEFTVVGTDKSIGLIEVAKSSFSASLLPDGMEPGLFDMATFSPEVPNFPNGCHICELEIDPETGHSQILRYTVVDDVGTVINPLTLEGQIHGGIGQAVGQVFGEQVIYDDDTGQLLTGSFLDYVMPRADDMIAFDCYNNPVPTKTNMLGVKGAGEAGNVGGLPAIMNAVIDALNPLGIDHIDLPATPEKVWQAIKENA